MWIMFYFCSRSHSCPYRFVSRGAEAKALKQISGLNRRGSRSRYSVGSQTAEARMSRPLENSRRQFWCAATWNRRAGVVRRGRGARRYNHKAGGAYHQAIRLLGICFRVHLAHSLSKGSQKIPWCRVNSRIHKGSTPEFKTAQN